MNQKEKNNLLWVGTIVNTHGVKGEVRLLTDSDNAKERYQKGNIMYYYTKDNSLEQLVISSSRPHKQFILLTFEGINNINDIEWLKGEKVYLEREELKDNEYYLNDLVGLEVIDQNDKVIGIVDSVVDQGPYDSLIVKLTEGNTTNIPMVDEFKVEFNKTKNIVQVNIPEEFLDI